MSLSLARAVAQVWFVTLFLALLGTSPFFYQPMCFLLSYFETALNHPLLHE